MVAERFVTSFKKGDFKMIKSDTVGMSNDKLYTKYSHRKSTVFYERLIRVE